jgi:hypothetical protein
MSTVDNCGDWNYPSAQDKLLQQERRSLAHPRNESDFYEAMHVLRCKAEFRGYIIVGGHGSF